jgi:16S rRNA C967 or C1407 C5-methylase (RsmB/RsmF family)
MARPRKVELPIRLNEWLRRVLRDKRPEDRWKIFKEWRREHLKINLRRDPTDGELESEIKLWQQYEFYLSTRELVWIDTLRYDFLPKYHKENRIKRARTAAIKSWSAEGRKNRTKE